MPVKAILSKSTFLKGLQCDKHLYLYKHFYNLQDPISEQTKAVFERGHKVGALAQTMFHNGIDATPSNFRASAKAVEDTLKLIADGTEVIYEAAFMYNEVVVYADIIVKNGDKWDVYEVKSSTSVSETYINDICVQYYVMANARLDINDISIIYINTDYVRSGELDLEQLFNIESLNEYAIANQSWIPEEVERQKAIIGIDSIPDLDIGLHCYDPYQCSYIGHCWKHIPENSVFDISGMHMTKKFDLYNEGIISLEDIPDELPIPANQRLQIYGHNTGESVINKAAIEEFLKTINYPLYFMDFESFQPAIPLYDLSKPYQQIAFQYSLHYQESEESQLKHMEFLAEADLDPRIPFIEKLLIDTEPTGQIVVYNRGFEKMILNSIAKDFPEYAKDIEERVSRLVDLMIPFQKKWYYMPEMKGSYSIKAVLPALVPELSYDNMEISDGGSASVAFEKLIDEEDLFIVANTRQNLLEYCKLDTLAMIKILQKLINES